MNKPSAADVRPGRSHKHENKVKARVGEEAAAQTRVRGRTPERSRGSLPARARSPHAAAPDPFSHPVSHPLAWC